MLKFFEAKRIFSNNKNIHKPHNSQNIGIFKVIYLYLFVLINIIRDIPKQIFETINNSLTSLLSWVDQFIETAVNFIVENFSLKKFLGEKFLKICFFLKIFHKKEKLSDQPQYMCAKSLREKLEKTYDTKLQGVESAKDFALVLKPLGIYKEIGDIDPRKYDFENGDIIIMVPQLLEKPEKNGKNNETFLNFHFLVKDLLKHGHVQIYQDNSWFSDFKQKRVFPWGQNNDEKYETKFKYVLFRLKELCDKECCGLI